MWQHKVVEVQIFFWRQTCKMSDIQFMFQNGALSVVWNCMLIGWFLVDHKTVWMCSFTVWPNPFFDMCNFLQPRLCWKRSSQGFKTWFQKSLGDIIYIATSSVTVGPVQNLFGTFILSEFGWQGHQTEQRRPNLPLPGQPLQLFQEHTKVLSIQPRHISPQQILGLPQGSISGGSLWSA